MYQKEKKNREHFKKTIPFLWMFLVLFSVLGLKTVSVQAEDKDSFTVEYDETTDFAGRGDRYAKREEGLSAPADDFVPESSVSSTEAASEARTQNSRAPASVDVGDASQSRAPASNSETQTATAGADAVDSIELLNRISKSGYSRSGEDNSAARVNLGESSANGGSDDPNESLQLGGAGLVLLGHNANGYSNNAHAYSGSLYSNTKAPPISSVVAPDKSEKAGER